MSGLSISGYGVVCAAGRAPADLLQTGDVRVDVRGRYAEPLPHPTAAVADVDVRAELGRKGTSFLDRATVLTLVACGDALRDAGLDLDAVDLARVGVVLGTTTGSLKSTMDYCCDTLTQERPYLVNPVLFPNTVMNCAAGQTAIWFGLRGLNATVAGGPVAFLHALRYATGALRRGYADMLLTGAVEEFTPHTAWDTALTGRAAGRRSPRGDRRFRPRRRAGRAHRVRAPRPRHGGRRPRRGARARDRGRPRRGGRGGGRARRRLRRAAAGHGDVR